MIEGSSTVPGRALAWGEVRSCNLIVASVAGQLSHSVLCVVVVVGRIVDSWW